MNIELPEFIAKPLASVLFKRGMQDHNWVMQQKATFDSLENDDRRVDFIEMFLELGIKLPWVVYTEESFQFYSEKGGA